jgi:hypothetical protein
MGHTALYARPSVSGSGYRATCVTAVTCCSGTAVECDLCRCSCLDGSACQIPPATWCCRCCSAAAAAAAAAAAVCVCVLLLLLPLLLLLLCVCVAAAAAAADC